jgi:hypothetical protein
VRFRQIEAIAKRNIRQAGRRSSRIDAIHDFSRGPLPSHCGDFPLLLESVPFDRQMQAGGGTHDI